MNLARTHAAGLPVPRGFIVSTAAYRHFVKENHLDEQILRAVTIEPAGEASVIIQNAFQKAVFPQPLSTDIIAAYHNLIEADQAGHIAVAVRSSSTSEDLADASFAGQQESYLNIHGEAALCDAICRCFGSLWTERAIAYRAHQRIPPDQIALAVVVQIMEPAEASGVLFTANPITTDLSQAIISAAWGLGEAVVGGKVIPDYLVVEKENGRVLERRTANKQVMTISQEQGTAEQQVPDAKRTLPVLRDADAAELTRLGVQIEQLFHHPVDIEWAWAEEKFWILQARPITTLHSTMDSFQWNTSQGSDALWSNVNFGEAITTVMTPLTWSVLQFTLEDWVFVPGRANTGIIGGYPYLNISVFASLFKALGRSSQDLLRMIESTIYLPLPPEVDIPTFPLSRRVLLSSIFAVLNVQRKQWQGVRKLRAYLETTPGWFEEMRDRIRMANAKADLLTLFQETIRPHIKQGVWCVLGITTKSADYSLRLRNDLAHVVGPDDADTLISSQGDPPESLASLGPVIGLEKVSRGELSRLDYLTAYGHRGPHEFELSLPRPVEDPEWFDQEIIRYRQSPMDIAGLLQRQRYKFENAWQHLKNCNPHQANSFHRRMMEGARLARLRENARSEYVRDRWLLRIFSLRAGELCGLGNDIFFLTSPEVMALLSGQADAIRFIPKRKDAFLRYQSLPPYPSLICGPFDPFAWAADPNRRVDFFDTHFSESAAHIQDEQKTRILGAPGSAGCVEGIVRCLSHPEQGIELQPGEILVAVQTDIAWTLVFPRAAAVVTDIGAPLSHAAIVARELGIPAVVGCGEATGRLKTGDKVRVDGSRGTVEILEKR